jgi:hypothetical protein
VTLIPSSTDEERSVLRSNILCFPQKNVDEEEGKTESIK